MLIREEEEREEEEDGFASVCELSADDLAAPLLLLINLAFRAPLAFESEVACRNFFLLLRLCVSLCISMMHASRFCATLVTNLL